MLENLLDIEIAYNMLKTDDDGAKDPLDMHYEKLKTKIEVGFVMLHFSLTLECI